MLQLTDAAGADVMNSLANTLLTGEPSAERRAQAEAWITKALDVIDDAKKSANGDAEATSHCDVVLAAALFNHASLREVRHGLHCCTSCLELAARLFPCSILCTCDCLAYASRRFRQVCPLPFRRVRHR